MHRQHDFTHSFRGRAHFYYHSPMCIESFPKTESLLESTCGQQVLPGNKTSSNGRIPMANVKQFFSISIALPFLLAIACALTNSTAVNAQEGTSSMSYNSIAAGAHRGGNGVSGSQLLPLPETIRVEEFVNYHEHDLPPADAEEKVRLSLRHLRIDNDETLIQVGITTPQQLDSETIPPLNLVLVIDQSGSMDSENRIGKVRNGIEALVKRFRKSDRIAIVGFSDSASIVLDSCRKTNRDRIRDAIESICADGSTNLHAGLRMGYEHAMENFDPERTNRVLFLTDGNANVGVTEPSAIAKMSSSFNKEGISLSTIGVGQDFNQQLLTTLADAGQGLSHFVGDQDDIEKIFVRDFESLLAPVAKEVRLKIDFGVDADDVQLFGYSQSVTDRDDSDDKYKDDEITLRLKNLNSGVTQVVMATIPTTRKGKPVKARLTYRDVTNKHEVKLQSRSERPGRSQAKSIKRDYAIALLANGIKRAAEQAEDGEESGASRTLTSALRKSKQQLDGREDDSVTRVRDIAERYIEILGRKGKGTQLID